MIERGSSGLCASVPGWRDPVPWDAAPERSLLACRIPFGLCITTIQFVPSGSVLGTCSKLPSTVRSIRNRAPQQRFANPPPTLGVSVRTEPRAPTLGRSDGLTVTPPPPNHPASNSRSGTGFDPPLTVHSDLPLSVGGQVVSPDRQSKPCKAVALRCPTDQPAIRPAGHPTVRPTDRPL